MSAENDDPDSEVVEKKSYNFIFRLIVFTFIAGPASVFAVGLYGRVGIKSALAAMDKGEYSPMVFLVFWIGGLISTGVMVFKR